MKWILWLALTSMAAAQSLTLPEALRRAQESNPDVIAAERNVSVVRTGLTIAGGRPNPRLAFEQPLDGLAQTKTYLRVEVPLELGGRREARLVVAEDQVAYAQQQVELLRWQTRSLAMQAYYDAVSAGLNLDQLQQAVDLAGTLVDVTGKRFQDGDVPEADVIRARFEQELARQRLIPARNRRQQALLRLTGLWGSPASQEMQVDSVARPGLKLGLAELQDLAVQKRMEIGLAFQEKKLNQDRAALAEANQTPNFGVASTYYRDNRGLTPTWQVGFYVDILWGYDRQGEVDQANAEVSAVEARLDALRVRILQEVAAAYADYDAARQALLRDEDELAPAAQRVLQLSQKIYQLGKGDLTQVLVAQKTVLTLRESIVADLALLYTTSVNLEKVVGHPIFP